MYSGKDMLAAIVAASGFVIVLFAVLVVMLSA